MTIDLFDSETGIASGHTATIDRAGRFITISLSTGISAAFITTEAHPAYWYLVTVVAAGFSVSVHRSDWMQALG